MPLIASAGLMATVSATLPRKPAVFARSCADVPSEPTSPSRFRLLSTSSVCHRAASCSCGLSFRSVVHPAWCCTVYTFWATALLSRLLSACAAGAFEKTLDVKSMATPTTVDRDRIVIAPPSSDDHQRSSRGGDHAHP